MSGHLGAQKISDAEPISNLLQPRARATVDAHCKVVKATIPRRAPDAVMNRTVRDDRRNAVRRTGVHEASTML